MKDLLDRLQKCDPATYQRAFVWLKNVAWDLIKSDPEKYFLEPEYPLRDAILQAVLQEACMSKNWHIQQGFGGNSLNKWAYIFLNDDKDHYLGEGDTPAQALLAAYIAAKEAT